MSSLLYKKSKLLNVQQSILFNVQTRQEKLAEKVQQVMKDKDLSYRDVAEASRGGISHGRIHDIVICRAGINIQSKTLKGLAKGLGIPAKELTDIMFDKIEEGTDGRRLVWYFSQLPETQRGDVLAMVEALYERHVQQSQDNELVSATTEENEGVTPIRIWEDQPSSE